MDAVSREYEQMRLSVLSRLLNGEKLIAAASIEAVLQYTMPPDISFINPMTFWYFISVIYRLFLLILLHEPRYLGG